MASPSLDYWRGFFSGARATIFDTIDAAIRVAAADSPDALRASRDAIAHRLFTVLPPAEEPEAAMVAVPGPPPTLPEGTSSVPSLCSSDGAAVTHRHDTDDPVVAEVFRVKAALSSSQQMSEDELLELLGRLQQLKFTVDTIKVTEIGKAIKHLKKHGSKQIRQLARSLIEGWHAIVNEWMSSEAAIVEHTPQSMDSSCLEQEEGGLPSPPMDEDALFATLCSSIQLSEFFDEMDDDGNIKTDTKEVEQQHPANQESIKKQLPVSQKCDPVQESVKKQLPVSQQCDPVQGSVKKQLPVSQQYDPVQESIKKQLPVSQQYDPVQESIKKQLPISQQYDPVENWRLDQSVVRKSRLCGPSLGKTGQQSVTEAQEKPSNAAFGPGRPHMLHSETIGSEMRPKQLQDSSVPQTRRRSNPTTPNPSALHDQSSFRAKLELAKKAKLESSKRKLQEGYQELSKAKQQRTVQMVDPQDLPKQGNRNLQPNGKARLNSTGNIRNRQGIRR